MYFNRESRNWVRSAKKYEIYVAAFGVHFMTIDGIAHCPPPRWSAVDFSIYVDYYAYFWILKRTNL